jgi:predicted ATPase
MLTYLNLKNFKIWKSTGPIDLAPVTLLLGTNSSGKSSLIQSLLLIRQTVKSDDPNIDLNLGNPDADDSVMLGQFRDVLCKHGSNLQMEIEFFWKATQEQTTTSVFSAHYRRGSGGSAELDYLRLGIPTQSFIVQRRKPGIYRLLLGQEKRSRRQSADFRPERSFAFSAAAIAHLRGQGRLIENIGPQLLAELSKIIYLGPVRQLARRDYVWNGRMPATIGDDGSKAVDALIASGVAVQNASKKAPSPEAVNLYENAGKWLQKMKLADRIEVRRLGDSARYELLIEREGRKSNIKDVGVGVSQVLPVIVAALYAQRGHIVIVEEPESHLHPLAQTVLADLFLSTSKKRGVQFIVETHSEHLFMRLQRRTAEATADGAVVSPTDIAMFFCKRDGVTAKVEKLLLDAEGEISNWPEDFFGDEMGELSARTIAAMSKKDEAPK